MAITLRVPRSFRHVCFHGRTMRISRAYVGIVLAAGVLLAACSTDEAVVEEGTSSPSPSVSEPSSLPSPSVVEPEPIEPVESVREVSFSPVDPGMLGMHVAGAQEGDWPSGRVPVESFRLWDTGTSWLQIDLRVHNGCSVTSSREACSPYP
jgi:hypothetical protein